MAHSSLSTDSFMAHSSLSTDSPNDDEVNSHSSSTESKPQPHSPSGNKRSAVDTINGTKPPKKKKLLQPKAEIKEEEENENPNNSFFSEKTDLMLSEMLSFYKSVGLGTSVGIDIETAKKMLDSLSDSKKDEFRRGWKELIIRELEFVVMKAQLVEDTIRMATEAYKKAYKKSL